MAQVEAFCLLAVAGGLLWNVAPVNDVAWQLWIGRQLLHGSKLYVDIMEVNPPLWFWMAVPVAWIAGVVGLTGYHTFLLLFLLVAAVSMLLAQALIKDMPGRGPMLASVPVATLLIGLDLFGQREQFALVATVPYVLLYGRRATGLHCRTDLAIVAGCLAAIGLALKPYFLTVPIGLEIWLWLATRRFAVRAEMLAGIACFMLYGAAVLLFAPAYFRDMMPLAGLAYGGYDRTLAEQVAQPAVVMAGLVALGLTLYGPPKSRIAQALLMAGAGFLVACFLQQKGWRYQSLPAMGFLLLAVVAEAGVFVWRAGSVRQRASLLLFAMALLCPVIGLSRGLWAAGHDNADRATQSLHPGDVVMVLSTSGGRFWPLPEERGFVWPSRHMTYWMLIKVMEDLSRPDPKPELVRLAARIRREAAEDLLCHPPRMILVDRYNEAFPGQDIFAFFSVEPRIARLFENYRRGADYGEFSTYALVRNVPPSRNKCRPIY
jgi:hypothetical protein